MGLGILDVWLGTKLAKHLTQSNPKVIKRSEDYVMSIYYLTICTN